MAAITKARNKKTGEVRMLYVYPEGAVLLCAQDEFEDETLTESDIEILPESSITKEEWLEHVTGEMEGNNYHSEIRMVENAVKFMTDKKAIEYLSQLGY